MVRAFRSGICLLAAVLFCADTARAQGQGGDIVSFNKINTQSFGFGGPSPFDTFGHAMASIGDLDGDGIDDIAVGESRNDDGATDSGAVWILFLKSDGAIKARQKIANGTGGLVGTLTAQDEFGSAVAAPGDIDGDGNTDLAVGAWGDDDGGTGRGAVWILFLDSSGLVKAEQKISSTQGGFLGTLQNSDGFGISVAGLQDRDQNGVPDLLVGSRFDDDGGFNRGAAWLVNLNSNGTVKSQEKISDTQGGFLGVLNNDDVFGSGVAGLGDVDGDGVEDIAIAAMGDDDGGPANGAVWILFLKAQGGLGGSVKGYQKISELAGGLVATLSSSEFGSTVSSISDYDGDGVPDIGVGARRDTATSPGGSVYLLFLKSDGTVKAQTLLNSSQPAFAGQLTAGDEFGNALTLLGDIESDGNPNIAVGAWLDDDGGSSTGAIYVLNLSPSCPGLFVEYGAGCPGGGGFTPHLYATQCPEAGVGAGLGVEQGVGGALCLFLFGLGPGTTPIGASGCDLLITPVLAPRILVPLGGSGPGNGAVNLGGSVPASAAGIQVSIQCFSIDAAALLGFTVSNGLTLGF